MDSKSCRTCIYQRQRMIPDLLIGSVAGETLKIRSEWNAEWKRREQDEYHRFCTREPFFEEPFFYHWCGLFTRYESLRNRMIDGRGCGLTLYALCAQQNRNSDCLRHRPTKKVRSFE